MLIKMQYLAKMNMKKGCADNYHLIIDEEKKEFSCNISPYVGGTDFIDVKRKSDLQDLAKRLEFWGYKQVKSL